MSETFQDRITILINENDLSQREAAEKIGTSRGVIKSCLDGRSPKVGVLIKICRVFGVSADWLLGLSDKRRSGE